MRRNSVISALVVVVCLSSWSLGAEAEKSFPTGKFTMKGPDESTWALTFDLKGTVLVSRNDEVAVEASYKVDGQTVEFKDLKGPASDIEAGAGSYKWSIDGDKLTFVAVKDEHQGRKAALTKGPWVRAKVDEKPKKE